MDLNYCIKWSANSCGLFGKKYTSVTPEMAEHVTDWICHHASTDPEVQHMTTAVKLTKEKTVKFGLETIPEVDEADMELLTERIKDPVSTWVTFRSS